MLFYTRVDSQRSYKITTIPKDPKDVSVPVRERIGVFDLQRVFRKRADPKKKAANRTHKGVLLAALVVHYGVLVTVAVAGSDVSDASGV